MTGENTHTTPREPEGPLKCFVTFRLRVTMEEYVEWFRTENLAAVDQMTALEDYRVWARQSVHEGEVGWDIIEEMAVLDLERCQQEFDELPAMVDMQVRWREMTTDQSVVFAELVHGERPSGPPSRTKCFVLFRLNPGTSFGEYEAWLRERNLPAAEQLTATRGLRIWRRFGTHEGEPAWDVIEELDVVDADRAAREFEELPAMQAVVSEWRAITSDNTVVFAEEIQRTAP